MENGKWKTEKKYRKQKMENGSQKTENGKRKTENGGRPPAAGSILRFPEHGKQATDNGNSENAKRKMENENIRKTGNGKRKVRMLARRT